MLSKMRGILIKVKISKEAKIKANKVNISQF